MVLTQDFKQTVIARVERDPTFARALLDEPATLFLNGEPHTARLILRDLVTATIGFEGLADELAKPVKSLYRMLSGKGNPSMDDLAAIFCAVRGRLGVDLEASRHQGGLKRRPLPNGYTPEVNSPFAHVNTRDC
jgi:DNA-binding phage protein